MHSDFVFRFINEVLRAKDQVPVWQSIETIRHTLQKDTRLIPPQALGANPTAQVVSAGEKVKLTAVPPLYGRLLFRCAAYFKAHTILELGSGAGISTLYLGSPKTTQKLITLEGNPVLASIAQKQANKLNLNHVETIAGDFDTTLYTALGKLGNVDLAFIDGDHRKVSTIKYYEQILPYTHNDTVLIFDDIHWSPEMQEAWQHIIARPEVTLSLDLYRMGLVFFRKEFKQPQHMQLYYW